METEETEKIETEEVELIASGYEWTCPECETFNKVIGITETVTCGSCHKTFKVQEFYHVWD